MTPPCRVFQASQLPATIQFDDNNKRRKGGSIDLSACELLSMVQYDCQIDRPDLRGSRVECWPVQRWFRRYVGCSQLCFFFFFYRGKRWYRRLPLSSYCYCLYRIRPD